MSAAKKVRVPLPRASRALSSAAYRGFMFGSSKICRVPLARLLKTQASVWVSNLAELRRIRKKPSIWVVRVGDCLVILDGHHRTFLAIEAGRKSIRARVYVFGEPGAGKVAA